MNPPPQAAFLYYGPWTAEADLILLDTMIKLKKETNWTENQFPSWFLMTAEQELRSKAGVLVSEEDISKRLVVLLRRYKIFKDVSLKFGAKWDRPTNYIIACEDVWTRIMKVFVIYYIPFVFALPKNYFFCSIIGLQGHTFTRANLSTTVWSAYSAWMA